MDLENFEFRPLTDGLGFDKTTEESKTKVKPLSLETPVEKTLVKKATFEIPSTDFELPNEAPVSRSLKKMLDSLPPSVDFSEDKLRERAFKAPLTKEPEIPVYPNSKLQNDFDVTLDNSLSQAFPREEVGKRFYHQLVTPVQQFKEIPASFASAIIDGLVTLALASLFVVALVAITGVDIVTMLTHSQLSTRTMIELTLLYFGVTIFYFMLGRGLFGCTLGDWAFDVQLGTEEERYHMMYPFQVIFRTFIIIVTGIITIPLVSAAFGKDIAANFSGLKLYSRQY